MNKLNASPRARQLDLRKRLLRWGLASLALMGGAWFASTADAAERADPPAETLVLACAGAKGGGA